MIDLLLQLLTQVLYEQFSTGDTWKYLNPQTNPPTNWETSSYNDSAWSSGASPLGYGNRVEVTTTGASGDLAQYFRKTVSIPQGALFDEYELQGHYDDGITVYVNGAEVHRENMPAGAVNYSTLASSTVGGSVPAEFSLTIPNSAFVAGDNVIAAEVHQVGATSSDIQFDLQLSARYLEDYELTGASTVDEGDQITFTLTLNHGISDNIFYLRPRVSDEFAETEVSIFTSSGTGTATFSALPDATYPEGDELVAFELRDQTGGAGNLLQTISATVVDVEFSNDPAPTEPSLVEAIAYGDTWKYYNGETDPGSWTSDSFDDSSWSSGATELGFGDSDEATAFSQSTANTMYAFRKTIDLTSAAQYDEYDVSVLYDDGYVLYVNGVEQRRGNMPSGTISWGTLAPGTSPQGDDAVDTFTLSPSAFNDGENVIAVSMSQNQAGSSDLSFNFGLTAKEIAPYVVTGASSVNEGDQITFTLTLDEVSDGTFYLRPVVQDEFAQSEQSITTSGGTGTATFSALPDATYPEGDELVNFQLWSGSGGTGTFLTSISTTVVDVDPSQTIAPGTYEQFAFGATWKYYDLGTNPGAFTGTSYDDSGWSSGAGELGFGDGDEATTISDVNQVANMFRKTINITDGNLYEELDYDILFDDGVVLYVNDEEQARSSNWPSGAIAWNTLATGTINDAARLTGTIPASALVDGDNVIAVQVSQNSTTSSDVSFNMGLSVTKLADYYTLTGPSSVIEGNTATYTVNTNVDATPLYYTVTPTGHFVETDGSFAISGGTFGTGSFTLSAAPDGTSGNNDVTVQLRSGSTSGNIEDTVVTTVQEDTGVVAGYVSFQQGVDSYAGTTDTYVQSGANEATNRGSATSVIIDKNASNERFAFVKFDDIENAFTDNTAVTVVSAGMTVNVNSEGQGTRIYKMNESWAESTTYSTIGTKLNGASTDGTTGYPASAMSVPTAVLDNNNFTGTSYLELDASTVQEWINNPSANHGMVFVADHVSDGLQFRSSEQGTVSQRPMLTIAYTE